MYMYACACAQARTHIRVTVCVCVCARARIHTHTLTHVYIYSFDENEPQDWEGTIGFKAIEVREWWDKFGIMLALINASVKSELNLLSRNEHVKHIMLLSFQSNFTEFTDTPARTPCLR
jgi:hypothetical protein